MSTPTQPPGSAGCGIGRPASRRERGDHQRRAHNACRVFSLYFNLSAQDVRFYILICAELLSRDPSLTTRRGPDDPGPEAEGTIRARRHPHTAQVAIRPRVASSLKSPPLVLRVDRLYFSSVTAYRGCSESESESGMLGVGGRV